MSFKSFSKLPQVILSAIARGENIRSKIEAVVKRELGGYIRTKFIQSGNVTNIGGYWDRKGENEIDLSVVNEFEKQTQIIVVKRKAENMLRHLS